MIQQQISNSSSLQIGYIGSHGTHNMFDSSNQANPNQQTLAGFNCSSALRRLQPADQSADTVNPTP